MEESNYNQWHSAHVDDNDISTPWHNFAKDAIREVDADNCNVLEIGCGRGGFSKFILDKYPTINRLFACDYSESALAIARRSIDKDANVVCQKEDIQSLSFPDNTFETIISCETIEHVPNPHLALKEMYRVLKKGGKLILTCPNYFNPFGIWCFYRFIIGKPFDEGGQPYVNYVLMPLVYLWVRLTGFTVEKFRSSDLIIPARVPKHFFADELPLAFKPFGFRTFYILRKQ